MLEYSSIAELCRAAEQAGSTISQTALADQAEQMEQPADVLYQRMADSLGVMRDAVRAGMDPELRSTSGLTGGDAAKMARYAERGGGPGHRGFRVQRRHGQGGGRPHSGVLRHPAWDHCLHAGGGPV
jgi:hypothetical protein